MNTYVRPADQQGSYAAPIKPALGQYKTLSATTLKVLEDVDET